MKAVRCGNAKETPYLRKHLPGISRPVFGLAVDLGAGNLRNTKFARDLGWFVLPFDRAGDNGSVKSDLGTDRLPLNAESVDLLLCNYLLCFMDDGQRRHLMSEIDRVAKPGAHVVVEMYKAKTSIPYDIKEIVGMLGNGWRVVRMSKERFIARKSECSTQ